MEDLLLNARNCTLCSEHLPLGPRPVFSVHPDSRILIIGQAPGTKVHATGIPWNDQSGRELRRWLGVDPDTFYDPRIFAIMPMGFCYPGRGKGGDLPPRPECAPTWHSKFLGEMPRISLTILIGQYAIRHYLQNQKMKNLTETVRNFDSYLPTYFPLVHPSPRNKLWQKKNPWFEELVVPALREKISMVI